MISPITRLQPDIDKRRAKKHERLEKIMELAVKKRRITNNDVELLVHVTDATATRYLSELVKTDRLERRGVRAGSTYAPKTDS